MPPLPHLGKGTLPSTSNVLWELTCKCPETFMAWECSELGRSLYSSNWGIMALPGRTKGAVYQGWHISFATARCTWCCFFLLLSSSLSVSQPTACHRAEKSTEGGKQEVYLHTGRGMSIWWGRAVGYLQAHHWRPSPLAVRGDGDSAGNCLHYFPNAGSPSHVAKSPLGLHLIKKNIP